MAKDQKAVKSEQVVTVDGKKYEWTALSKEARAAFLNLNAIDGELKRLRVQAGIAQIARKSTGEQLKKLLPAK